ncbi:MAG TPA: phytanoyl-CoA dioxygenase family protein [Planctomycetota bacterium]|nr:phytanoyl-CoA dioxygenase family protein [Planctomycetota bacterium]
MTVAHPLAAAGVPAGHRFLFDLQGFVLLRGVLSPGECASLLGTVRRLEAVAHDDGWRQRLAPEHRAAASPTRQAYIDHGVRLNGLLRLDPAFDALIDHPRVLPYVREFMGAPQVINTWSISKAMDTGVGGWHRGATPMQYWCREGVIRSAMLNAVWFLSDNGPDDGCMCAVPGSHKSDLARLGAYDAQAVRDGGADFDYAAHPGLALPGSVPITGSAGDVLVFSEALIHGGLRKTTPGLRTNLYVNHLHRLYSVAGHEPANMRHFWLPERLRERFTPARRELTDWMRHARYELDE